QWKALNKLLNAQKQKKQAEQQSALKACRKHINIIDNLIVQGKFKSAMVRFAKLSEIYQQMPVATQQVIEKRYLQIEADIARLEGWQNYIAAPRKPQLIEQAQALVATTDTDMPGRAKAVKVLRQQWQSLGSTGSDDDESLNQQFNALLEEAFVPCRVYFAELETAQANAAEERVQLISALSALIEDTVEQSDRYTRFEALKKQWQQAPQTDAERYSQLRTQWDAVSEQVNNLLSPWIQRNREIKEQLVSQTEALSKADNAVEASEQAKALQQQWKQTGPAGKRVESKLWFAFKAANDDVFARAKSQQQQARHQQRSESQQWLQALDKLKAEIDDAAQASQQTALDSLADSLSKMSMNPKERKGLELQLRKVMSTLQDALTLQQHELWGEQIDIVIDEISKQQGTGAGSLSEQAPDLPNSWWKGSVLQNEEALQHDLLMLEVLAQLPSPAEYESARSTVQLQLMQSKLSGNALPEPNVLIAGLIASAGAFESSTGASWEHRLRDILSYYVLPVAGV
ncbi:DUF349 domain-containing protein, partial [Alteromonas sp. AMM-1]|uniref:DUF349 domain-containing protein n=1 Tax=Alteromonas sp. AMM-1 TaxID=3394233 RepID=UPI0039A71953